VAVLAGLVAATGAAAAPTISEFQTSSSVNGVTSGPDGAIWFTEPIANKIGRFDLSSQQIAEYPAGSASDAFPYGITAGPDGNIWFTEQSANKVARMDITTHAVTEFSITKPHTNPTRILAGPDGQMWVAEIDGGEVSKVDPVTGTVSTIALQAGAGAQGLAIGADGNVWVTERDARRFARIVPATSQVTTFAGGLSADAGLRQITPGPDGNLWFTEFNTQTPSSRIGKIDPLAPTPTATEFSDGIGQNSSPVDIVAGSDGALWFTEGLANKVGRLDPATGTTEELSAGITTTSGLWGIAAGPDGNVFFAEGGSGHLARVNLVEVADPSPPAEPGADPSPARCHVPRVVGKRLAVAKRALAKAHCSLGKVKHRGPKGTRRWVVKAQSRRAGRSLAPKAKVSLVVRPALRQ
jgi:streptogramin lyase